MLLRPVPVIEIERDRPDHAQRCEHVKNRVPAESEHDAGCHEGRNSDRKTAEKMGDALDPAAFCSREPQLHAAARHGEGARFAESEKKTRTDERTETEGAAGHRSRQGPPWH